MLLSRRLPVKIPDYQVGPFRNQLLFYNKSAPIYKDKKELFFFWEELERSGLILTGQENSVVGQFENNFRWTEKVDCGIIHLCLKKRKKRTISM